MHRLVAAAKAAYHALTDDGTSVRVRGGKPWSEECFEARQQAALSMMDDGVVGFMLMTITHDEGEAYCQTHVSHVMDPTWWPIVLDLVRQIAEGTNARAS